MITGLSQQFDNATLQIINLSGKTVERKKINSLSDSHVWSLRKTHSEGIYLISIHNRKDKIVRKVFMK